MPELGSYTLYLGDEEIELDIDNIVPIAEDLTTEFTEQPSLYAYVAMLAARAEAAWIDAKNALAEANAIVDKAVRLDLIANDEKVTEGKVAAEVRLRRGYQDALMYELDSREQHLIMRALTQAMDMRAQMLISLGAQLRAEANQTGMLIRETKKKLDDVGRQRRGRDKRRAKAGPAPDSDEPSYSDNTDYDIPF